MSAPAASPCGRTRLPLRGDSPICPSVQRALSACGGSAKAQRAMAEAKTPALDALFLLSGFASLAMCPQDVPDAWGGGGDNVLKTGGDNPWPE